MRYFYVFLIVLFGLLTGCSLERKNPLDPQGNSDIQVPNLVTGIQLFKPQYSSNKYVRITWDHQDHADGYYVYRALTLNGVYEDLTEGTGILNSDSLFYVDYKVKGGNFYFYKLSAFKDYGKRLEGPVSTPKGIAVQ
ncbi:MAG: hypothetical protein CSB55_02725 [Candidatus Cloacimonadota bacterium]|nr:MAG: hypothetical protein CSB55_02725 [Candidatus Cloacimonadota bacterium]